MSDNPTDLLAYADIAVITGLSAATLRGYRTAGRLPEPDDLTVPDRPRWHRSTITTWLAQRPGRGAPGKPRKARTPRRSAS